MSISTFVPAAMDVTTFPVAAGIPSSYESLTTKQFVPGFTTLYTNETNDDDQVYKSCTHSIVPPSTGSTNSPSMYRPRGIVIVPLNVGVSKVLMNVDGMETELWGSADDNSSP
jgi:hypothetical protein